MDSDIIVDRFDSLKQQFKLIGVYLLLLKEHIVIRGTFF
jgi:hypothetical protein